MQCVYGERLPESIDTHFFLLFQFRCWKGKMICVCVLSFIDTRPMKNCVHSIGIYWNYTIGQTQQQPSQRWQISEAWIGRKMWKVMFSKCSFFGGSWFHMHCITETWRCLNTACFSRLWMQKEGEKKTAQTHAVHSFNTLTNIPSDTFRHVQSHASV